MNLYETDDLVSQYMAFHYGTTYFGVDNYPSHCAALCIEAMAGQPREKALDLGCAVGRSTFELARGFKKVVGVDLSSRFIDSANALREHGRLGYFQRDEGELGELMQADLKALGLDAARERVEFREADACALKTSGDYDLIFAGNLIDRLHDPKACLAGFHRHLRVGGLLVISSPYTLLTDYTPRENWIGGYIENGGENGRENGRGNGRPVSVLEGIERCLKPYFERVGTPIDLPFVIRETRRKFQHTIAEVSVWRRCA